MSDYETRIAAVLTAGIGAASIYFSARPECDSEKGRNIFRAAFLRAWASRQAEVNFLTARVAALEGVAK